MKSRVGSRDGWSIEPVDSSNVAGATAIALDSSGHPYLANCDADGDTRNYAYGS
jgi:hypothetical protein